MSDPTVIVSLPQGPILSSTEEVEETALNRPKKPRERLEFALPTINVIFLLMLYFLIAGTIVQKNELSVIPPVTAENATNRLPRPLLIVSEAGFTLDGRAIERTDLIPAINEAVSRSSSGELNLVAPAEMGAGPFIDVLNVLGTANIPVKIVMIDKKSAAQQMAAEGRTP